MLDFLIKVYTVSKSFIVFGGASLEEENGVLSTVGQLNEETLKWSKLGNLNNKRYNHNTVHDGKSFLVIGGARGKVW